MDNYTTIGPSDQDSNLLISIFLNFLENFNIGLLVIVFKEKRRKLKTFVKYILLEYQKKEEIFVDQRTLLLTMSEAESFHDVVEDEVHFKEDEPRVESSSPPTPITSNDMDVIIEGWEVKFEQISRCLREVQLASEKASSEMFSMTRDGRARENLQERRIEAMHVGLTEFLERSNLVLSTLILAQKYHFCPYLALFTYIWLYLPIFRLNYPYLCIISLNCLDFTISTLTWPQNTIFVHI